MERIVQVQANPLIKKDIDEIQIPDLWHLAMSLDETAKEAVLEVWHLCHSLKKHIQQNPEG